MINPSKSRREVGIIFSRHDIKTVTIAVFHMFKKIGKILNMLGRELEDIKITQIKLLEMKTRMPEIKYLLDCINCEQEGVLNSNRTMKNHVKWVTEKGKSEK